MHGAELKGRTFNYKITSSFDETLAQISDFPQMISEIYSNLVEVFAFQLQNVILKVLRISLGLRIRKKTSKIFIEVSLTLRDDTSILVGIALSISRLHCAFGFVLNANLISRSTEDSPLILISKDISSFQTVLHAFSLLET